MNVYSNFIIIAKTETKQRAFTEWTSQLRQVHKQSAAQQ